MIKKVLILGSAALKIGEAGEFDYSGSQAIKALKEEGISTILVNPNIATIQTSENLADEIYFLPVNAEFVEKVIQKTRPDGILLSFGGQTALNTGLELQRRGILEKYKVAVLGTPIQAIINTEDRQFFITRLSEISIKTARSQIATTFDEALNVIANFEFPVIIRIAYALGGLGSGVCRNLEEFREKAEKALNYAPQILIEEYLEGWKEIEYEVMCDRFNNCITICNMENVDPMGIHTGESIVVAPCQTLSNRECQTLRSIAIKVIRHLGIVGECNIQFALDPYSEDYRVIEVNARLSRSSALASKATGYPIAFVAAKLALGHGLHQLPNKVTRVTTAFFEPALDYVVVKIPRWDLKKFRKVSHQIGSGMKSVGEVMAIGRTFEEALQKGLRMLETGANGIVGNIGFKSENLERDLHEPTDERIFAIAFALEQGFSVEKIAALTNINPWFIHKIKNIVEMNLRLNNFQEKTLALDILLAAKKIGFSDKQVAIAISRSEDEVRQLRIKANIKPYIRQIDTLAAEFPAYTNYLYLTYNAIRDDINLADHNAVIVLGSGAYRIGSSVEFDWSCVNCGQTLRRLGYNTIMLNYNPETVSTDYDESDFLIFDEISFENVVEIYNKFRALGVIVSMGGQIPNNLALKLHQADIRVLGTSPESIDRAENRRKFSDLLDKLNIDQPIWKEITSIDLAREFAREHDYPVLIRPSYVLSGAAMAVASNDEELVQYLQRAVTISPEYPTVISKFLENAKEIEYDAVARNGEIVIYAISEHVENAGVHSGDATLVIPPQRTYLETVRRIRIIASKIARKLNINGPFNIQFIAKQNEVKVIECNLRASRSFPFVSKVIKRNFIDLATQVIMRVPVTPTPFSTFELNHVGVKAPQFSFTRLQGADPTLGVEMASTGEVACLGDDFDEAFLKALISVGYRFPVRSALISSGPIESKAELLESVRALHKMNVRLYATGGTAKFLEANNVPVETLFWPLEKKEPNVLTYIKNGQIDLVINIPKSYQERELTNGYLIRRTAADFNVMLITNRQIAMRFVEALGRIKMEDLKIRGWGEY
ncbi:MAG: carbamoyl-phosphate synthase (glutamine-hydrolyzing) large subunit [Candidatus Marinimicrobia bacterium]|jgi:carbamoyl-phosphate synthase large subunit|nr:carbamoyl-phosphate synthase (glutamine-hydrolyzing) large subunit [Candidatus Neomarinimicrobiota bacterium]MCK9559826.1 carbamoyl-phosphate synthase (glutamine-hydrolyzing) large subunit [Candidatus Neomarinimicrobiota bacterium]MDD5230647.1 carbamoyl-phosphate synthase (glutamine-hydrolyzing) large subunit [Candidatus Neomarinimicrobiota bacterium]MDD5540835.1 carbamoyl-phosphate synthase (glutamine-hydrolyzing) large subunit [Candidatus Neomarinimicrobiota bacterium]